MNELQFCSRHQRALEDAIDLRGIDESRGFDATAHAKNLIIDHACNFAGKAAVSLLSRQSCPICFCNEALRKRHVRDPRTGGLQQVDGWVENAADEALEASKTHREQGATASPALVTLN